MNNRNVYSNNTIQEFYYDTTNHGGIVQTEYVKQFILQGYKIGKRIHIDGSISFAKTGVNVELLTNLPFTFPRMNRVPTSTWLNRGQAILFFGVGTVAGGAFGEIVTDAEYAFNFEALVD